MMFLCAMLCGVLMQTKVIEAATNANVDIDEDGNISFEEFLDFMEVHYENVWPSFFEKKSPFFMNNESKFVWLNHP